MTFFISDPPISFNDDLIQSNKIIIEIVFLDTALPVVSAVSTVMSVMSVMLVSDFVFVFVFECEKCVVVQNGGQDVGGRRGGVRVMTVMT